MMSTNETTLNTAAAVRPSWAPGALVRPLLSREAVAAWADRLFARWLRRSQARAAWRQHMRALNSA